MLAIKVHCKIYYILYILILDGISKEIAWS